MTKTNLILFTVLFGTAMVMNACKDKDEPTASATYPYEVNLTDTPGQYTAVNIDIQSVEVTGGDGGNIVLNVNPGIYNLLDFTNGLDTLIASSVLGVSTISQIRLILGPNNTVVVDSVTYPLKTPSAQQSGLKIQVHQTLQPNVLYSVLLDFDANKSIVQTGNGEYQLKPVIRIVDKSISGAISGNIAPIDSTGALVMAVSHLNDTFTTSTNPDGYFLLQGLPAGTYSFNITPAPPLNPYNQTGINVTVGQTVNLGTIQLQ
jgi:hypothetical protein